MTAFAHKLKPINAQAFKAWRISTQAYPIDLPDCDGPEEALNAALPLCGHKDHLAILQAHSGRNRNTLRLYAIKRESKPKWRRNPVSGEAEQVRNMYPECLFTLAVKDFAPEEIWKWTPDADVVGVDRELVEQGK